jgi:predicted phosphodiesterase
VRGTWTRERAQALCDLIDSLGGNLKAACEQFGVSEDSATGAVRRHLNRRLGDVVGAAKYGAQRVEPIPAPVPVPVAPPSAPAWQGYAPRPGWEPPKPQAAKPRVETVRTSIVLADLHIPYSHKPDLACAKGVIREVKPDALHLLGDIMEMEALSRHPKSKPDLTRLSEEYYATNVELDDLQNCAENAEVYYEEGNHCARAARFACEFGPLDGMLSVPQSLYIEPRGDYHRETAQLRGIRWIPLSMQPFVVGEVAYLHGVFESRFHAQANADSLAPRHGAQVTISGHMHGFQAAESAAGFRAYACPWLGDDKAAVFRAYVKGRPKPWSRGLLIVEEAGPSVTVTHVAIEKGRALFLGRVVAAAA